MRSCRTKSCFKSVSYEPHALQPSFISHSFHPVAPALPKGCLQFVHLLPPTPVTACSRSTFPSCGGPARSAHPSAFPSTLPVHVVQPRTALFGVSGNGRWSRGQIIFCSPNRPQGHGRPLPPHAKELVCGATFGTCFGPAHKSKPPPPSTGCSLPFHVTIAIGGLDLANLSSSSIPQCRFSPPEFAAGVLFLLPSSPRLSIRNIKKI